MFINQGQVTPFSHNTWKTENIEEKVLEAALLIFQQVTIKCIKKKNKETKSIIQAIELKAD